MCPIIVRHINDLSVPEKPIRRHEVYDVVSLQVFCNDVAPSQGSKCQALSHMG